MVIKKKKLKRSIKKVKRRKHKKKRKQRKDDKNALPEVDKELYEIQISDLSNKLERTKEQCSTFETENEEVRLNLKQVDDDRADVIAYLKRTLQTKIDEVNELQERIRALQMSRDDERIASDEKYFLMKQEYEIKVTKLSSELNLSNEKLKSLEEFRLQRDDLLREFQEQQNIIDTQENVHKEALRTVEKEYTQKNIQMKKEVDERLLQLSDEFQSIIQSKTDTTTKITMNENYLLNKEINKIMETCKTLINDNAHLKKDVSKFRNKLTIIKDGMKISLQTNSTIKKELNKALCDNEKFKFSMHDAIGNKNKIIELLRNEETYKKQLNLKYQENNELSNIVQSCEKELLVHKMEKSQIAARLEKLEKIMKTARSIIKETLEQDRNDDDNGGSFVLSLLSLLETNSTERKHKSENTAENERKYETTVEFLPAVTYDVGKLGIMAKRS